MVSLLSDKFWQEFHNLHSLSNGRERWKKVFFYLYLISVWYIYSLSTFRHIAGYAGAPGHTHLVDLFHLLHRTFAAHIEQLRHETPRKQKPEILGLRTRTKTEIEYNFFTGNSGEFLINELTYFFLSRMIKKRTIDKLFSSIFRVF